MEFTDPLKAEIKQLLVANLMLQVSADQIGDETLLFGQGGLGLDSVDALQVVVALDKHYGLKIPDPATAKRVLQNISTIALAVAERRAAATNPPR
jgi:acyl carrier protein